MRTAIDRLSAALHGRYEIRAEVNEDATTVTVLNSAGNWVTDRRFSKSLQQNRTLVDLVLADLQQTLGDGENYVRLPRY